MFAVVEHDQGLAPIHVVDEIVEDVDLGVLPHADGLPDEACEQFRIVKLVEPDEPGAVPISHPGGSGYFEGEAGFAGTARSGERHQAMVYEQL